MRSRSPHALFIAIAIAAATGAACGGGGPSGFLHGDPDVDGGAGAAPQGGSPGGSDDAGGSGSSSGSTGSGGSGSPGTDAGASVPFDGAALPQPEAGSCTNGSAGLLGLVPGGTMAPGSACVTCHLSTGAGKLNIAGTVYSTLHEPDGCIGVATGVSVVITDAQGTAHTLAVNSSGNFYDNGLVGFATPYTAKVVSASGASIPMISKQTSGDCDSCHTAAGAQAAAGRIVGP